jgi:hypothetical protein
MLLVNLAKLSKRQLFTFTKQLQPLGYQIGLECGYETRRKLTQWANVARETVAKLKGVQFCMREGGMKRDTK